MWPFTRRKPLTCFYCLKETENASHIKPYNWRCPECGQVNQRHPDGEIVTDHPAMSNVLLNHSSWQRRASVPDNAFPPLPKWSPFCTQCVTNQKLIYEMLANYLPDESDPDYKTLLANAPAKRIDLETRYPPLCEECRPLVEAELRKNHDAATSEIRTGSFLRSKPDSPLKDPPRKVSTPSDPSIFWVRVWKLRAFLWLLSIVLISARDVNTLVHPSDRTSTAEHLLVLSTILWMTWDPSWFPLRKYQKYHVPVRIRGKVIWTISQLSIFVFRAFQMFFLDAAFQRWSVAERETFVRQVAAASLVAEILVNSLSYRILKVSPRRSPKSRGTRLPSIPKAPPRHSASDGLTFDLHISDPPRQASFVPSQNSFRQTDLRPSESLVQASFEVPKSSSRQTVTTPRSRYRPNPIVTPPTSVSPFNRRSPALSDPSPTEERPDQFELELADDQMDWEPTPDPIENNELRQSKEWQRQLWQRENLLKPRTFPNRHAATGLEDLLTSWSLGDSDTPRGRNQFQDKFSYAFESWASLRIADVLKVIALLVGYTIGQDAAVKTAWAFVAVLSTYELGERRQMSTLLVAVLSFGRAILPLPLFSVVLGISSRKEAFLWDAFCILCITLISLLRAFS